MAQGYIFTCVVGSGISLKGDTGWHVELLELKAGAAQSYGDYVGSGAVPVSLYMCAGTDIHR